MKNNGFSSVLIPVNWTLEINGCKDYPLEWKITSADKKETKSGPINDNPDFVVSNLSIKKGRNEASILVSNDGNNFIEFNLDELAYESSGLRNQLKGMLEKGLCRLNMNVVR